MWPRWMEFGPNQRYETYNSKISLHNLLYFYERRTFSIESENGYVAQVYKSGQNQIAANY